MASKIIVDQLESSGSNITIPTGTGLVVTDGIAATNLSGTIADARLPTVPVTKGGTGLTSLGSAGQIVKVNSGANALEFGTADAGAVKQVVVNTLPHSSQATTSASFTDIANSETTLTPSSTSSKILIMGAIQSVRKAGNVYVEFNLQVKIGSGSYSDVDKICSGNLYTNTTNTLTGNLNFMRQHSPNTTEQVYYKLQFKNPNHGSGSVNINNDGNDMSTITLMETT